MSPSSGYSPKDGGRNILQNGATQCNTQKIFVNMKTLNIICYNLFMGKQRNSFLTGNRYTKIKNSQFMMLQASWHPYRWYSLQEKSLQKVYSYINPPLGELYSPQCLKFEYIIFTIWSACSVYRTCFWEDSPCNIIK